MTCSRKETARQVLEVVPLVMRTVRTEMRRHRAHDLSVPQFRALGFVQRRPGASLSDVAEHIGLTLPAMSKLIDGLVTRKLMTRRGHADDRRRVTLELTARGAALLQTSRESTHAALAERLSQLSESDRAAVVRAMHILLPLFAHETTSD
jgi:DNA-binding MarR family transcriptional regulator